MFDYMRTNNIIQTSRINRNMTKIPDLIHMRYFLTIFHLFAKVVLIIFQIAGMQKIYTVTRRNIGAVEAEGVMR
ncbi:hypothetical protein FACS189475_10350 [Betaproteobacteria bacterium]|nr:hypothetical protein FACS189475_10350 [Betaproteobacteria bacterium]